ncbi:GH36-type glycosyl hydrolase domain-containing protein [Halothermothrix orenii]|uniref:Glycosyltransferase 36 n=1 Tax=Halothermothrix orenii (strain H 168 / OCM 544 / DSM 9562) TaxID=373903 RepID=B8CZK4_HALOH|nr:glycosyl transferase [Halothermothrix orenii]ACL70723.1 glycosyltransferase 36 [Halothermothrix orenii H 168]
MSYGYFDSENKEYVITNPRTPTPWINYIGGGNYGGIVSQTGGGYSFDGDPRFKRVLRYRYNSIPEDQPGRYIYLRDIDNNNYWSATWQPVKADFDEYVCRHGLGYTTIEQKKDDIVTSVTYFVPGNESLEIWQLNVKNLGEETRHLSLYTYAEFSFFDAVKDQQNVDWTQQIQQGEFEDNILFWNAFMKNWEYIFMTSSIQVTSYETSRERFVGCYRDLSNPIAVEESNCSNYLAQRGNGVGCLNHEIKLEPGCEKEIIYILGTTPSKQTVKEKISSFLDPEQVEQEKEGLKKYWDNFLSSCEVDTPDPEMNLMLNTWNQYQCKTTFNWSRFVSLYQLGINRGMGFRDSAQDVLGVMHAIPDECRELIIKLFKIQHQDGHAYHLYYPLTGEGTTGEAGVDGSVDWYSDDHLWIIISVAAYLKETGDFDFLTEVVPYADNQGEGTVLEHLCKALEFTENHKGKHNIPLAGFADWNDTINLDNGNGVAESVWTGMLYCYALKEMLDLLEYLGENQLVTRYQEYYQSQREAINKYAWDGDWYLRAYDDNGEPLGSQHCEHGKIFLNPQSWSIMAGIADNKQQQRLLQKVDEMLNTEFGVVLVYPAYHKYDPEKGGITTYPPGAKENGGIFLHTNPWLIIAETMLGNGNRAYQYYRKLLPPLKNDIADRYEIEPYVYCQNILGKEHPQFGLGRNSWLTGTAAWMYRAAVYYILGVRPTYDGLIIDPVVPSSWENFSIKRKFRGKVIEINCIKSDRNYIRINGVGEKSGNKVSLSELTEDINRLEVYYT